MLRKTAMLTAAATLLLFASPVLSQKAQSDDQDDNNNQNNQNAQPCGTPLPDGTLAWWPLDEAPNSLAVYDYANSFSGSVFRAKLGQSGQAGSVAAFDGIRSYISFGNRPAISGNGPFTVDLWLKTSNTQGVLIQQRQPGATGFNGEYVLSVGGGVAGGFASSAGAICWATFGDYQFGINFCSTKYVDDNRWHHVAATREIDGSGLIYIDGALAGSQAAPARNLQPFGVFLGADKRDCPVDDPAGCLTFEGSRLYLNGSLAQVRIINRPLPAPEVGAIYTAGAAGAANVVTDGASPSINLNSHGKVRVVLCSSPSFDPRILDPLSITFAGATVALKGNGSGMFSFAKVSSCQANTLFPDLALQFQADTLQLHPADTFAILEGATLSSIAPTRRIRACESVSIVGPDKKDN
jgi:hypothetical protein